jgi:ATP-binding cassette subfamily F protein 3
VIQLSGLTKSFGERVLLDNVSWQVTDGERVGLCGPNGAGKTTLLKMLAGLDEPDQGLIVKPTGTTVGYLPQDGLHHHGRTLFNEVSLAFEALLDAQKEIDRIEHALADPALPDGEHETLLVRYHELSERFRREEGFSIELKVAQVLQGLGFSKEDFEKATEAFSGGWQMRIALAKLLLGRPTLLLLDEPTNHLDLDARNWLEEYLVSYPHAVILVSHDRFFLDAVVTKIADLALRTITDYHGTYSKYLVEREARMERLRAAKKDQDEEIARMRAFIDRFRYQATKAAQVQSRIKLMDKIVPIDVPPERKRVKFTFPACPKSGRVVLELKHASKAYGSNVVLNDISLHVERGDRIALVAPNGAGKSTLMRLLSGAEAPDSGERTLGHQVVMDYFAQDEADRLDKSKTVYQTLEADSPVGMVPMIRNILGGFLFEGDDITKKVSVLSGGERTRLAVARMLLRPANTLLLDEPTNHLDLDSKDVLLEAIEDFGGTLIFVSHDRYFVDRLATKVIIVSHGGIEIYPGRYEEYLWAKEQRAKEQSAKVSVPAAKSPAKVEAAQKPREVKKTQDAESRKKQRAEEQRARRIADLETRIANAESAIKDAETEMSAPGFYDDRDASKKVIDRHQALMWEVRDLMEQWEELQKVTNL